MYKAIDERIRKALRHHIRERYKTDVEVTTERPPRLAMGEVASPVCFELAKRLKKPPRALAQEIANSLKPIEGVARVEVAGGGYLNLFLDRATFFRAACEETARQTASAGAPTLQRVPTKTVVEHTSINPNKAAHIGHLRNAVLGDTFCADSSLRRAPRGGAKLHRQHGRAGGGRGLGIYSFGTEDAG